MRSMASPELPTADTRCGEGIRNVSNVEVTAEVVQPKSQCEIQISDVDRLF